MTETLPPITGDDLKAWGHRPSRAFPSLIDRANAALTAGADHETIRALLADNLPPPHVGLLPAGSVPLQANIRAEDPDEATNIDRVMATMTEVLRTPTAVAGPKLRVTP